MANYENLQEYRILKIIPFMFPEHVTPIPRTDQNRDDFFTHLSPVLGGRHPSFLRFESSDHDTVPGSLGGQATFTPSP